MEKADNVITPQEKEDFFLRFFHSYLTYLTYICKVGTCEEDYINKHRLESCLTNSLTLIWQLHIANSTLKMYYNKVDYDHGISIVFKEEQSNFVILKLRELKLVIKDYTTIEELNKRYCLSMIEQIKCYYEQDRLVIVDPSLHSDPWLANSVKPEHPK